MYLTSHLFFAYVLPDILAFSNELKRLTSSAINDTSALPSNRRFVSTFEGRPFTNASNTLDASLKVVAYS
jgi:hypothetical protein